MGETGSIMLKCFLIEEERKSQVLLGNLSSDLFPINELHNNFEIK